MRMLVHAAAVAVASLMLAAPATAQSDEKGFRPKQTCPPYCPLPRPPAPGGGGSGGGGVDVPGGDYTHHPRRPRWRPREHYYNYYGPSYGIYPRYYDDPYFARPRGYGYYDDNYSDGYDYEYVPRRRVTVSCSSARSMLRRSGYRNVKAIDCKGRSFGFIGQRNGKRYQLTVSARSGAVISRKRL